jgi:AcrR family transcriptional regulator
MARPREFDRDQALRQAMTVFWEHGYEATSTDDLLRAMGIGRQSMYDAFGDKHQLYLEALQLYETETGSELFGRVAAAPSPFVAICDQVLSVAEGTPHDRSRGCFHVNATTELAPSDPDVRAMVRANNSRCVAAFEKIL